MTREPVEAKGRRYLVEGRLVVTGADDRSIEASCRGGGAVYELGHDGEAWWCSCPARGTCAHLLALRLVTVREQPADDDVDDREPQLASSAAAVEDQDDDPEPRLAL